MVVIESILFLLFTVSHEVFMVFIMIFYPSRGTTTGVVTIYQVVIKN